MAIPTYFGAGTFTAAGAAASSQPPFPASTQAGDIAILVVQTEGYSTSLTDAQGFAELGDQANKDSNSAGNGSVLLATYWKRLAGSDTAPTIAASTRETTSAIHVFRGCVESGDPWNVYAEGAETSGSSTVTIPGATTTVADCLVAAIVAHTRDADGAQVSGWTNANLANLTERLDESSTVSYGGGHALATGEKAAAGAYGNTTATISSSRMGYMSIALKPGGGGGSARSFAVFIG